MVICVKSYDHFETRVRFLGLLEPCVRPTPPCLRGSYLAAPPYPTYILQGQGSKLERTHPRRTDRSNAGGECKPLHDGSWIPTIRRGAFAPCARGVERWTA
eukprot:1193429-Prorocentrum_minimum.AAC.1